MSEETPTLTFERLIKLLKLSTSPNDAEALLAVRKANEAVKAAGWDWERLLRGKVTIIADPFTAPPPRAADVRHPGAPPPPPPRPQQRPAQPPPRPAYNPPPPRPQPRPQPQPAYAQKAAQSKQQRRANPVNIDDLL